MSIVRQRKVPVLVRNGIRPVGKSKEYRRLYGQEHLLTRTIISECYSGRGRK